MPAKYPSDSKFAEELQSYRLRLERATQQFLWLLRDEDLKREEALGHY